MSFEMSVSIPPDEKGYVGRECPSCKSYFKIKPGTGLSGTHHCICPYCGHNSDSSDYFTQAQIDYATSIAVNKITGDLLHELKRHEFDYKPRGGFGIGVSLKVKGKPHPIQYYREEQLETEAICEKCTLEYTVYGVFSFCPDCGAHNSLQILENNLTLVSKMIGLEVSVEGDLKEYLLNDALENVVSSFDGFGRELCRVNASKASDPKKAESISFQNLKGAQANILKLFGLDLASTISASEWDSVCICFQKRHLTTHKMGVVDAAYIKETGDSSAVIGHKIKISEDEITQLVAQVRLIASTLVSAIQKLP